MDDMVTAVDKDFLKELEEGKISLSGMFVDLSNGAPNEFRSGLNYELAELLGVNAEQLDKQAIGNLIFSYAHRNGVKCFSIDKDQIDQNFDFSKFFNLLSKEDYCILLT